jgi:hypothetical protein
MLTGFLYQKCRIYRHCKMNKAGQHRYTTRPGKIEHASQPERTIQVKKSLTGIAIRALSNLARG